MAKAQPTPDMVASTLAVSLGLVYRRMRQPLAEGELTLPERSALSKIGRDSPLTAAELAKQEQISPQSMGATLAALESRGLIARAPDPSDGRRAILSLTAAGATALHAKRAMRDALMTQALASNFTDVERAQLMAVAPLLERLAETI
jgi:DNA-binding MarR family transcriptional regulator